MRISALRSSVQRLASAALAASSRTYIVLILAGFIPLRVFLSLRSHIIPEGDGLQEGLTLGRFWLGQLTLEQLFRPGSQVRNFLRERTSQLLYPLLLSFQPIIGWNISTHLLVLNTILGIIMMIASYGVALRISGKTYAVVVALLMCSLTGPYWIARMALVDNLFYALLPLFALAVTSYVRHKTAKTLTLMILATGALVLTRPESFIVIGFVGLVLVWELLRRYFSRQTVAVALLLSVATTAIGTVLFIRSSPSFQKTLLSTGNVSTGLAMSAETFANQGQKELNEIWRKYDATDYPGVENLAYLKSLNAIAIIKAHPLWYALKIPIRGLLLLFPWTYQPWSRAHILYEAAYTLFVATGFVLLLRRGTPDTSRLALMAIPLSILFFLSVFGIDNDLKHRNGVLVGLNLIAPLGYFMKPRGSTQASDS